MPPSRYSAYYGYRHIPVTRTQDEPYPWKGDVCLLDRNPAVVHDTGNVDSKVLGINSRRRPLFGRRNICAPSRVDKYATVDKSLEKSAWPDCYWTRDRRRNMSAYVICPTRLASLGPPGYDVCITSPWLPILFGFNNSHLNSL